jgi:CubicO group peptidase (beta-lactamase class C family)
MASLGAARDADFEIGSVSKGITGLLYADACGRGELGPDATLGGGDHGGELTGSTATRGHIAPNGAAELGRR